MLTRFLMVLYCVIDVQISNGIMLCDWNYYMRNECLIIICGMSVLMWCILRMISNIFSVVGKLLQISSSQKATHLVVQSPGGDFVGFSSAEKTGQHKEQTPIFSVKFHWKSVRSAPIFTQFSFLPSTICPDFHFTRFSNC